MMDEEDMMVFLNKKCSIKTVENLFFTVDVEKIENGNIIGTDKYAEPISLCISEIVRCFVVSGTDKKW